MVRKYVLSLKLAMHFTNSTLNTPIVGRINQDFGRIVHFGVEA